MMTDVTIGKSIYQVHQDVLAWMKKQRDIACKVKHMRELQKEYFKSRDKNILRASKAIEKEVDDLLDGKTPESVSLQAELFR
jgi:hypothetical protein